MKAYLVIEMPKACVFCELYDGEMYWCRGAKKEIPYSSEDERSDNCPLVEIPPHGRLIDADALRDECSTDNKPKEDWEYPWYEAQSMIDNAPTIIPADGGET